MKLTPKETNDEKSLDEEVPTGISEPPLEKAWKKAFVTTLTHKIR